MREFDLGAVTAYAIAVKHGFEGTEKEWVAYMQANATQAKDAEENAKQYAENAKTSATNANKSAQAAKTSETNAEKSVTAAQTSAQNAAKSAQEAKEAANKAGGVKTVNGKTPDANGNVEIDSVASWDDLTDKPFIGGGEVLPECQPPYDEDEGAFYILENIPTLKAGASYTVNWNGTEYNCIGQDLSALTDGVMGLGDCSVWAEADPLLTGNGEPFVMLFGMMDGSSFAVILPLDGTTELTISITGGNLTLDPEYLPDGVPYVTEVIVEILPECQPTRDENNGSFIYYEVVPTFAVGETYIVNYNGTEYECVGQLINGGCVLGNLANYGGSGNGEPFALSQSKTNYGLCLSIVPFDGTTELTLSIYQVSTHIRKLDNRCLDLVWFPESTVEEVQLLSETAVQYNGTTKVLVTGLTANDVYRGMPIVLYFDGVRYECEVYLNGGYLKVSIPDSPYWFQFEEGGMHFVGGSDYDEHIVSVYTPVTQYRKLPPEYLPTDATVFHLTSPNGTKFAVTVSDDGTLSASAVTE